MSFLQTCKNVRKFAGYLNLNSRSYVYTHVKDEEWMIFLISYRWYPFLHLKDNRESGDLCFKYD